MERRIDPDAPLDYVELQIFPSHNRYEAFASTSNRAAEKVASGDLQQLLSHIPQVKDLSSKSPNSNFKILPPDDVSDPDWFTAATLTRFLHVVDSPDILSIGNEISQLEETRKFQLSLFAKAEVDMTSSFESKNELLRVVDLRLSELKEKLSDALNQATGATCSPKDISDLENLSHHFGAVDIRDTLQKFVELSQMAQIPSLKDPTTERSVSASQSSQINPPVQYGVSPAKAAQIERQSSSDSDSSFSSEEDQPSVERSRNLARSSTPRRSASPMRRIQIGRSGPRRAATLSIKSLNYFPTREKAATQRGATTGNSSEDEDSEKTAKSNALRMSVQDKISLFENKKKDQVVVDTQKPKSTAPVANKAVLRRWSSGMRESASAENLHDTSNETSSPISTKDEAISQNVAETSENIKSFSPKKGGADILFVEMEQLQEEREESCEKHPSSIEWNQQKEAELNQLFTKMMETKPVRRHSVNNDNSKGKTSVKEQRGGFYDHYKQKREEKLRKEASGKKAEKEAQLKEMQQFLDEKKAEMASTTVNDVSRRHSTTASKPQKSLRNSTTQLPNSKKEASKTSASVKKAPSKPSSLLPATRKSWPTTTPSPRPTGISPAKTPSSATTPTRKPQSTSSSTVRSTTKVQKSMTKVEKSTTKVEKPTTKVEKPQLRSKTLKATPPDAKKSVKPVIEKKQSTVVAKGAQKAKPKARTQVDTPAATTTTAKPSFYNKVTKKGSVVPLETKPFLRKGTGIGPGVGAVVVKNKVVAQPEEHLVTEDLIQAEKNQVVETAEILSSNQEKEREPPKSYDILVLDTETETETEAEVEAEAVSPMKCEELDSFNQFEFNGDNKVDMANNNTGMEEESSISPTAWVEKEDEIIPCKESPIQTAGGSANLGVPAGVSSPRVRHSLFQMLLEETGEADSCEWGNAQHPPAMVNQKDAPKGFKRLLKFARKTKADLSLGDGSSPSSLFRRGSS